MKVLHEIKNHKLYILLLIITIIKIIYITDLPVIGRSNRLYDESLMTTLATSLKEGDYLGVYNDKTLIKGVFYPAFMALLSFLHIPYLLGLSVLYALACFIFTYALKDVIKKPGYLAFLYIILLWNPASFAKDTYLVLYRNTLGIIYALLLVATLFKLYQYRHSNRFYWYALFTGILIAVIYLVRGDPEWTILPTLFVLTLSIRRKKQILSIPLLFIPMIIGILFLSVLNYHYYHLFTDNEIKHSSYTKAFSQLLSIAPIGTTYDRVSISHETLKRAIEVSPTLQTIENQIEGLYAPNEWGVRMDDENYEIINAYMIWALRDALKNKTGYRDAKESDLFWKRVAWELEQAFEKGQLQKRKTTPFILLNTPSWAQANAFFRNVGKTIYFSTSYQNLYITIASTSVDKQKVESLTYQKVVDNDEIGYNKEYPYKTKLKFLSSIKELYRKVGFPSFVIALIFYVITTIRGLLTRKNRDYIILSTILLLSFSSIVLSISYTHTFSFDTISAFYLNPIYSLQIAFIMVQFISCIEYIVPKWNLNKTIF